MIGLSYYGAFDIRLCQIPTIAPYMPEGGGGGGGGGGAVGQYIDRCIRKDGPQTVHSKVKVSKNNSHTSKNKSSIKFPT